MNIFPLFRAPVGVLVVGLMGLLAIHVCEFHSLSFFRFLPNFYVKKIYIVNTLLCNLLSLTIRSCFPLL